MPLTGVQGRFVVKLNLRGGVDEIKKDRNPIPEVMEVEGTLVGENKHCLGIPRKKGDWVYGRKYG